MITPSVRLRKNGYYYYKNPGDTCYHSTGIKKGQMGKREVTKYVLDLWLGNVAEPARMSHFVDNGEYVYDLWYQLSTSTVLWPVSCYLRITGSAFSTASWTGR